VKAGAAWPKSAASVQGAVDSCKYVISTERRNFWSLQPLSAVTPPAVKETK